MRTCVHGGCDSKYCSYMSNGENTFLALSSSISKFSVAPPGMPPLPFAP